MLSRSRRSRIETDSCGSKPRTACSGTMVARSKAGFTFPSESVFAFTGIRTRVTDNRRYVRLVRHLDPELSRKESVGFGRLRTLVSRIFAHARKYGYIFSGTASYKKN